MKIYRTVKFDNGTFGVQEKDNNIFEWHTRFDEFETLEEANQEVIRKESFDKKWKDRKNRKVLEIID